MSRSFYLSKRHLCWLGVGVLTFGSAVACLNPVPEDPGLQPRGDIPSNTEATAMAGPQAGVPVQGTTGSPAVNGTPPAAPGGQAPAVPTAGQQPAGGASADDSQGLPQPGPLPGMSADPEMMVPDAPEDAMPNPVEEVAGDGGASDGGVVVPEDALDEDSTYESPGDGDAGVVEGGTQP